jgi:hypothetical protein
MEENCTMCPWAAICHDDNDKSCLLPETAHEALQSNGD